MSASAATLREALLGALAFEPQGEPAGNATIGRGALGGRVVRVALVENRGASGAIGSAEAERLAALLRIAEAERAPTVLYLDSAGAKVSEGLKALGAFRALYRAGLDAALAGAPIAAVLGRNCFGGSSMLAHLARARLFAPESQLAMSGPAVMAAAAGMNALDEMFRAMADAAISAAARTRDSPMDTLWSPELDLAAWLGRQLAPSGQEPDHARASHHEKLMASLQGKRAAPQWESVRRADLERLYAAGYSARESHGLLAGTAQAEEGETQLVGLVGPTPLRVHRAWELAELVWRHWRQPPARLEVLLDCASHAPSLEDERMLQTAFVVDMAFALAALARRGTRVGLTIVGRAGGGVFVALAAPAEVVTSVYGADIQVLPGSAVAAILGESRESVPSFDEYKRARVAEREIKLGIVPKKTA